MRKSYQKPILAVESFQLDAAIAGSCSGQGYVPLNHYEKNCQFDGRFFSSQCYEDVVTPSNPNDEICYHGPTATGGMTFIYS